MEQIEKVKFFAVSGFLVLTLAIVVVHNNGQLSNSSSVRIEASGESCEKFNIDPSSGVITPFEEGSARFSGCKSFGGNYPECQTYPVNNIQVGGGCSGTTVKPPLVTSEQLESYCNGLSQSNCSYWKVCAYSGGKCRTSLGQSCVGLAKGTCTTLQDTKYGCKWTEATKPLFNCGPIDPSVQHRMACNYVNAIIGQVPNSEICRKCVSQTADSCAFGGSGGVITDGNDCANAGRGECFYNSANSYRTSSLTSPSSSNTSSGSNSYVQVQQNQASPATNTNNNSVQQNSGATNPYAQFMVPTYGTSGANPGGGSSGYLMPGLGNYCPNGQC